MVSKFVFSISIFYYLENKVLSNFHQNYHQNIFGEDQTSTANIYNSIGLAKEKQVEFSDASGYYSKSFKILPKSLC